MRLVSCRDFSVWQWQLNTFDVTVPKFQADACLGVANQCYYLSPTPSLLLCIHIVCTCIRWSFCNDRSVTSVFIGTTTARSFIFFVPKICSTNSATWPKGGGAGPPPAKKCHISYSLLLHVLQLLIIVACFAF